MLRTCASPIWAAASARTGSRERTSWLLSTARWVVRAPICSVPPLSLMPTIPGSLRRSMRCAGCASRSFISATRLWLPASTLQSSWYLSRSASASFTVSGAWYSKGAGYMASPSFDRVPDAPGGERHVDVLHSQRRERVHHRVGDRRGRGDGAGLTRAFDAERIHRRRRHRP